MSLLHNYLWRMTTLLQVGPLSSGFLCCSMHLVQQQSPLESPGTPKEGMSYFFSLGDFGVAACEKAYKATIAAV